MAISRSSTIIDQLVPARPSRTSNLVKDAALVIGTSLLLALSAHLSLPLPFTPILLTLQTLVVLLAAAALGSKRASLAFLLYLAEGAVGLPVFSMGGGVHYLFVAASAGYLWGMLVASFVVGLLCERGLDRSILTSVLAMLPGSVIIYAFGMSWFALVAHVTFNQAFTMAVLPFIPGDLIKVAIAAILLPTAWSLARVRKQK
ncbi:biotin transporter BioY [Tengunoibacter tsumagoiensis]|uniref:Biotin transporter n=1 Tax=Tengunoibacter tsumagoiensis TaxID=2014871 RepID=A0A401ZVN2_9CHLR|nr:biotin transporter BioY [Tengunoibacter tsumagoiensis]GCE10953.1 biotin biosynthesis protein BioY [Tengunoibacter tsumagoiensis]